MKLFLVLLAGMVASIPGSSAILPGVIGPWKELSSHDIEPKADRPLWDEYGLQDAEEAQYQKGAARMTVDVWRVPDSTASMAAFDFLRPAHAKPIPTFDGLTPEAARIPNGALVALGNFLVRFQGAVPEPEFVANMFRSMPRFERSSLPTFPSYLPTREIPNTERYIAGPVALKQFFGGLEPSVAAFHLGAEAVVAEYKPDLKLALFSYPTPAIARDRTAAMEKVPGAVVKRSGTLVAVLLHPANADAAESLLSQVRYEATVTTGQKPPTKKNNPGNLLLNIFYLIAILMGFCLASGLMFGLIRTAFRRGGASGDGEELLTLHLERR